MSNLYKEAGVDLDKANDLVGRIKPIIRQTNNGRVLSDIGSFGGLFSASDAGFTTPVLVASTDGVGTKLKIAFGMNKHDTVGIDLVAMSVNDIIVQGAYPLFFLDYIAMSKIDLDIVEQLVIGIVEGCRQSSCALLGGETAEMPGFYTEGEYDMAGFAVGMTDHAFVVDGSTIQPGYRIIGLPSSGLHSNGYSLVRRIVFEQLKMPLDQYVPELNQTIGEALLEPTKIYVKAITMALKRFKIAGMVHVTGGGFIDNIPRILPSTCQALIYEGTWPILPIFRFLREQGNIPIEEMYHVFNNGIGYIIVIKDDYVEEFMNLMRAIDQKAYRIGEIVPREVDQPFVRIVKEL